MVTTSDAVEEAIAAIRDGAAVVVAGDTGEKTEGAIVLAAQDATADKVAFLVRYTTGVVCAPVLGERLDELGLPLMVEEGNEVAGAAFTVSVDWRHETTTGISAADRAATLRALADPATRPDDLTRPGHVFPLRYRPGGVLKRAGYAEAAIDLTRLAGKYPAAVSAKVVNEDGEMARFRQLEVFAEQHGLPLISIADLVAYRRDNEVLVRRVVEAVIPTTYGDFNAVGYQSLLDDEQHIALVFGEPAGDKDVLVRMHCECLAGDVFGSTACDCGRQLRHAMRVITEEGAGVIVYLRGGVGCGRGVLHQLQPPTAPRTADVVFAPRDAGSEPGYAVGGQILVDLGVSTARLLNDNLSGLVHLEGQGLRIAIA